MVKTFAFRLRIIFVFAQLTQYLLPRIMHGANPIIKELVTDSDQCFLLDILSTDLPLVLTVPKISDDFYWEKSYKKRWPTKPRPVRSFSKDTAILLKKKLYGSSSADRSRSSINSVEEGKVDLEQKEKLGANPDDELKSGSLNSKRSSYVSNLLDDGGSDFAICDFENKSWKQCYLEMHLQNELENLAPENYDPEKIKELAELCGHYVVTLRLSQLKAAAINNSEQSDHIPLNPILTGLPNLTELSICYKQTYVGEKFSWHVFQTTMVDIKLLAKGLEKCNLSVLRIKNSDINCAKVVMLAPALLKNENLTTLDFSHCKIADHGGLVLGQFILAHGEINILVLTDNRIGPKGCQYFAYALHNEKCKLGTLDLSLNCVGPEGGEYLTTALTKGTKTLKSLVLTGCGLNEENLRFAKIIILNKTLEAVDISNNRIGEEVGQELLKALRHNNTLTHLDIRRCNISGETEFSIRQEIDSTRKRAKHKFKHKRSPRALGQYLIHILPHMDDVETAPDLFFQNDRSMEDIFNEINF